MTFVGIAMFIRAFAAVAYRIVAFLERNKEKMQFVTGQSDSNLIVQSITQVFVALGLFLVASSIMSSTNLGRLPVAIVVGIQIVVLTWFLIAHHGGGFQTLGVVYIGIDIFLLWALYGHKERQEFHEGPAQPNAQLLSQVVHRGSAWQIGAAPNLYDVHLREQDDLGMKGFSRMASPDSS
jgi:hypothetical protein